MSKSKTYPKLLGLTAATCGVAYTFYRYNSTRTFEGAKTLLIPLKEDNHPHASRYSIVLDMDETLLHTRFHDNDRGKVFVRPHSDELLHKVASQTEMVLWTAGTEDYAVEALKLIGDQHTLFHHRIYRNRLWWGEFASGFKSLRRLNRDRNYTLLVDNSSHVVDPEDADHAIVVRDYLGGKDDDELIGVAEIIEELVKSEKPVPAFLREKIDEGKLERKEDGLIHTVPRAPRPFFGLF
ncbi:CTD small phosphatase-like protein 2 [Diplonema papillatum]|nr:CTD small phosphatase-like protein 2 [Diplonema papillatum]|eukprot:gene454-662_t